MEEARYGGTSSNYPVIDGTPYAMKVARAVWTLAKSERIARDEANAIRLGWKYGSDDWTCPEGYRMPTADEYELIKHVILEEDYAQFSYWHSIAIAVGG